MMRGMLRRIAVEILAGDLQPQPVVQPNDVDVNIVFRLNLDPTARSTLLVDSDKMEIIFTLAVGRVSTQGLRGGIAWIEHYLSPHPISAAVILSLLRYLGREGIDDLPERDKIKIEDTISRFREWLLTELFPTTLFDSAGYSVVYTGYGAFKEFLYLLLSQRWPSYEPLARLPIWSSLLADYKHALAHVAPIVQVGSEHVQGTKAEIAKLFRQNRHAGFQSHARQYGKLLDIETWQGDSAAIRFVPHLAELQLAERVRSQRSIPEYEVYLALRRTGFAAAETEQLIRLALARGLVQRQGDSLTAPAAISATEINMRVQVLRTRAGRIDTIPKEVLDNLETFVADTEQHRNAATAVWHLEQLEREVSRLEAEVAARADARREVVRRQLMNALPRLTTPLQNAPQSSSIEKHLAAVYRELNHERMQLKNAADTFIQAPKQQLNIEDGEVLAERVVAHCNQADLYDRWVSFAQQIEVLEGAFERLGKHGEAMSDLSTRTRKLMRSAKSVLAEIGLSGLSEVDWLQAKLIEIDQTFRSLADARRVAYQHVASMLTTEVAALISLHCEIPIPSYDPENDEYSFCVLYRNITKVIGRALALLSMSLSDEDESTSQERRSLAKLRSDIDQTAQQLTEPGWLIAAPNPYVRPEARARLRNIRERVSNRMHIDTPKARLRTSLITALSNLPTGPTEVTTLIANLNGITTSEALLRDLLQLHETGHLRLMIDLPSDSEQKAK